MYPLQSLKVSNHFSKISRALGMSCSTVGGLNLFRHGAFAGGYYLSLLVEKLQGRDWLLCFLALLFHPDASCTRHLQAIWFLFQKTSQGLSYI